MKTLLDCKNAVARRLSFADWDDYMVFMKASKSSIKGIIAATDMVAEEYRKAGRFYSEDEIRIIQEQAYQAGMDADKQE